MKKFLSVALVMTMLFTVLSVGYVAEALSASISVTVPENVSEPFVNMPLYENFEESTNVFDKANYNKYLYSMVKDTDNPDNTVLEYNLKGATTVAKYGGTIRTSKFTYPDAKVPYTVSFDFKKIADGNAGDCIWVQSRSAGQYTCSICDRR